MPPPVQLVDQARDEVVLGVNQGLRLPGASISQCRTGSTARQRRRRERGRTGAHHSQERLQVLGQSVVAAGDRRQGSVSKRRLREDVVSQAVAEGVGSQGFGVSFRVVVVTMPRAA